MDYRSVTKKASRSKSRKASHAKGKKRITVPVQSVVLFVKMLYDRGHSDEFIAAAKKSKAIVALEANSVEFVKEYLARRQLRGALAASVVDPCPGDPFECFRS